MGIESHIGFRENTASGCMEKGTEKEMDTEKKPAAPENSQPETSAAAKGDRAAGSPPLRRAKISASNTPKIVKPKTANASTNKNETEAHSDGAIDRLEREKPLTRLMEEAERQEEAGESPKTETAPFGPEPAVSADSNSDSSAQEEKESEVSKEAKKPKAPKAPSRVARLVRKPGFWCLLICLLAAFWLLYSMLELGLLRLSAAAWIVGLAAAAMTVAGFWFFETRNRLWSIPAVFLCVAIVVTCFFGQRYVHSISREIDQLSDYGQEYTLSAGLYVPNAVPLQTIDALEGQIVGVLDSRGNETNEKVLDRLKEEGVTVRTESYSTLQQLNKAVRGQKVRAAILTPTEIKLIHEFSNGQTSNGDLTSALNVSWSTGLVEENQPLDLNTQPYTVLVSASDTRLNTQMYTSTMTMLLTVNPTAHQVLVTVIPRALALPAKCDGTLGCPADGAADRAGLLSNYTIEAQRQALEEEFGTSIDFTVQVDLAAVVSLFDEMDGLYQSGGREYEIASAITVNPDKGVSGPKIRQILGSLSNYSGNDFDQELNQFVMFCDLAQARKQISFTNIPSLLRILDGSMITSFNYEQLCTLIWQYVLEPEPFTCWYSTVSGEYQTQYSAVLRDSAYMLIPDPESLDQAKTAIQSILSGHEPQTSGIERSDEPAPAAEPNAESDPAAQPETQPEAAENGIVQDAGNEVQPELVPAGQ